MSRMRDTIRIPDARMRIRIYVFSSQRAAAAASWRRPIIDMACKTRIFADLTNPAEGK
jgi:hypothetical protein